MLRTTISPKVSRRPRVCARLGEFGGNAAWRRPAAFAYEITAPWARLIERQQLGQVILEHEAELLVL